MSTATLPKAKATPARRAGRGAPRAGKRDIAWLVERDLPPARELPANPVLVLRRRS